MPQGGQADRGRPVQADEIPLVHLQVPTQDTRGAKERVEDFPGGHQQDTSPALQSVVSPSWPIGKAVSDLLKGITNVTAIQQPVADDGEQDGVQPKGQPQVSSGMLRNADEPHQHVVPKPQTIAQATGHAPMPCRVCGKDVYLVPKHGWRREAYGDDVRIENKAETKEEARLRVAEWRRRKKAGEDTSRRKAQDDDEPSRPETPKPEEPSHPRRSGRAAEVMAPRRKELEDAQDYVFREWFDEDRYKEVDERLRKDYGIGVEEYNKRVDAHLRDELAQCKLWTQMRSGGLLALLRQGTAKSVYEGGKSAARANFRGKKQGYMDARTRTEATLFGEGNHPFYGYLARHADGGQQDLSPYGPFAVRLKSDLKADSTFTLGDSLNANQWYTVKGRPLLGLVPSPVEDPSWRSVGLPTLRDKRYDELHRHVQQGSWADKSDKPFPLSCPEAQMHRAPTVDDIEEVVCYKEPSDDMKAALEKRGIPYRVVADKGYNAWEEDPGAREH